MFLPPFLTLVHPAYLPTCLLWSGEWGVSLARTTLQLLLTLSLSPHPNHHLPIFLVLFFSTFLSSFSTVLPLTPPTFPTPQQVMGQPVLHPEQWRNWFLQGCQEHHHTLQQWAATQPVPLPLRHHQWLQEEEERLHAEVSFCFLASSYILCFPHSYHQFSLLMACSHEHLWLHKLTPDSVRGSSGVYFLQQIQVVRSGLIWMFRSLPHELYYIYY